MDFMRQCLWCLLQVFLLVLCAISALCGTGFSDDSFYPSRLYNSQQNLYTNMKTAIGLLQHEPSWVSKWPDPSVKLGQVSGVCVDGSGQVLVFHRASSAWRADTFSDRHVYQAIGEPPIPHPTVLVFNRTGALVDMWGQNMFYMPHGITVDAAGNVWLTDVALHQVLKFTPQDRTQPALRLGEKFVPGDDDVHFCKPTAVAVLRSGEFFVADGYCNSRIVKFAPDGSKLLQWGRASGRSPFVLSVPHGLALAEDRGLLCVADREHGRVPCFRADNGTFHSAFSSWLIGGRLFGVAYSPASGGRLYVVNGPHGGVPVRGYVIDFQSGRMLATFAPPAPNDFRNPHDVAVSADASALYVAELDPHAVHEFTAVADAAPAPAPAAPVPAVARDASATQLPPVAAKPTATVEASAGAGAVGGVEAWRGALGGAAGGLAAALCALAALALVRARRRGGKAGVSRRRWEYASEFKLRRLLERRRFTRVDTDDSDEEPSPAGPMLAAPATA